MVHTNWMEATQDISKAIAGLISCLESGENAWIEIRQNGDQEYPIRKKNSLLDNPFNWTMSYGVARNEREMAERRYFNETEKDLTYNYVACFGKEEAIKEYQLTGKIIEGLIKGIGICHPVKISDANEYREKITGDGYEYQYWVSYWKPLKGISFWETDESIGDVFVVCYNNEAQDRKKSIEEMGKLLTEYSKTLH